MWRDQQAFAVASGDPLVPVDVRGHDGRACGHRLEEHDPEGFATRRGRGKDIRRPEQLRLLGIGYATQEFHRLEAPGSHVPAGFALLRPRTNDEQPTAGPGLAQDPMGLEQVKQALAWLQPTDKQDIGHAVLPARKRNGAGEARNVDAVGDHLVLAREEPVDEMARRRADRDPAVETRGVTPHDPAPELVGRREPGIGMERRDIDAVRLAQQEQRQERHEWLMEVEEVKPLARQEVADLAEVARRERQRPHGPVGRHAHADPDAQNVALRCALRTVTGGDDSNIVTAQAQVFVQEPDVLGDAAGLRVDVRTDQTDLHARPPSSRSTPSPSSPSSPSSRSSRSSSKRGGLWRPPG